MSGVKCYMCTSKGSINIDEAAQCVKCNAYFHQSCFLRVKDKDGSLKCCKATRSPNMSSIEKSPSSQPLDREFFKNELSAMRNDIINRIDSLETKFGNRLNTVESKIEEHDTDIIDLTERVNIVEQQSEKFKCDVETSILVEIADRKKRELNVIIYNLEEKQTVQEDISALIDNFRGAPFNADNIHAFRIGGKKTEFVRPLKVKFINKDFAHWLLINSKRGLDTTIKCVPDRTQYQRTQFKDVINELNVRKSKGENNIQLKYVNGTPAIISKKTSVSKNGEKNRA